MLTALSLRKLAVLLIVALIGTGCSGLTFVYGLAETALASEAKDHLDLDEDGEAFVDQKIEALLEWHSAEMLPQYARFMNAQADAVDRGALDRAAIDEAVVAMREILEALVSGASRYTADVLVNHTEPDKVRHLKEQMAEHQAERREELDEPPEEQLEARIERIVDNFERFTGLLTETQIVAVSRYAEASLGDTEVWLRNRANRQRVFTDFLAQEPSKQEISAFVYKIILRPHEIVDPGYKAVSEGRWRRFQELLYGVMTTLSDEQRKTMSTTLRGYAAEMLELAS
ncbi:MAG: hypothetical protein GKS00_16255 [Alphaproteobacteria bacterium]|nr:hypothetical protein [Alphaproteobacteria bacterium]